ncbi:FAD-dependent pyridine nucleotide-disulfide oxidoreductase [Penicillium paradoxum]|uniref:FAD-dependent pyridine nucleotide-disulfide oxidoreductase n=1 Tax=Penicillium paradoxum TaxID=176176 RepID=UPI002549978F|nr:FAD-dependent pyridine nucleotide-disulfide oxidoreductase [Penicillium paradoxum]KAJ5793783.1 FAD-dependent pyridine nucleotide-disulfide oxidoreductase [Penicillium paradoxum]
MSPKKVAVIARTTGAGPSGLVTAKTLLHNFPGTFSPIIFDTQSQVGGLWSSSHAPDQAGPSVTLDPRMRTNLSRFTVAFSDLAWESVVPDVDVPVFPRASQVGQYLACYTERYIPDDVLRLDCRVVRTRRKVEDGVNPTWTVQWTRGSARRTQSEDGFLDDEVLSEDFDLIVIASGYFAEQYIPDIPGLGQFPGQVIHSSALHCEREKLFSGNKGKDGNGRIVVIGGSMSGVEAASAVALHQSSSTLSSTGVPCAQEVKVHHIHSRPFWTLPTYLPHESSEGTLSFLPLDLAMYDIGRRPPGPIEYALGPVSEEKAVKSNAYFHALLGNDYERYAHMDSPRVASESRTQPPWVAIGNDYAEFVRSGIVQTSTGRVSAIHSDQDTGLASVQYEGSDESPKTIDNVAAIVMATGFTPYKSLSLLPDDVLATLEYSKTDPFSPLILDKGGTVRSEIPDVGFVGFYRGPYWGVMEMQARFLGKLWAGEYDDTVCTTDNQKQSLRSLRLADPHLARGQFPMGDYVGLMESFAKDLDISRSALNEGESQSGPVIPARYLYRKPGDDDQTLLAPEIEAGRTLYALRDALVPAHDAAQSAAASAVFRALHGSWKYSKQTSSGTACEPFSGILAFYPRYPTSPAYDREYVCMETHADSTKLEEPTQGKVQFIIRLVESGNGAATSRIEIWSSDLTDTLSASQVAQVWELTSLLKEEKGEDTVPGEYVISAKSVDSRSGNECLYTFHFEGVSISSWTCVELGDASSEDKMDVIGSEGKSKKISCFYSRC